MSKNIVQESDEKQYLVTTKNGKKYLAYLTNEKRAELQARGATVQDPATGSTGTSSVLEEAYEIQPKDVINISKQLAKAITEALRDHGDEISRITGKDLTTGGVTIKVTYKPDEEGHVWTDEFNFIFDKGKVIFKDGDKNIDVCPILQQSGTVNLQKDLVQGVIRNFIDKRSEVTKDEMNVEEKPEEAVLEECDANMLLEFEQALQMYAQDRTKDNLKNLLKAARPFPGDDIQHKFKAASDAYLNHNGDAEEHSEEAECPEDMHLEVGYALFLRLLEYVKEDAKNDLDLHYVAEKLSQVSREKGCATMDDYEFITGNNPEEEDTAEESEQVMTEGEQGLKSKKLYDIFKQYGGAKSRYGVADRHNLTDDDVVTTLLKPTEYWDMVSTGKLKPWMEDHGVKVNPEDDIEVIRLKNTDPKTGNVLLVPVVIRNVHEDPGKDQTYTNLVDKQRKREDDRRTDGSKRYIPDTTKGKMARDLRTNPYFKKKVYGTIWSDPAQRKAAVKNIKDLPKNATRHELEEMIFESYAEYLREQNRLLTEDKEKDENMIYGEGAVLPDATEQMLAKFPTLKHALIRLQTENFMEFIADIDYISPKPTEFRINLKNGQDFILKWMGKDFEATISGKKYYLGTLVDFERALDKLANLYQEGPMGKDEEEPGKGPEDRGEAGAGGGGGNFPGEEAPTEAPEEGPEETPEEGSEEEQPQGESGEETEDLGDETVDFEGTETI
jgi:hypothetical protein